MDNNKKYLLGLIYCIIVVAILMVAPVSATQTLKFGLHQNKPLNFRDDDNKVKGLVIDVFTHIADQEGWGIEYVPCSWKDCLAKLKNGDIDILSAIGYTSKRNKVYDFTETPLITNWGMVVTQPDTDIQSILDLEGKKIAVMKKAGHTTALTKLLKNFRVNVNYLEVDDFLQVFKLVQDKKADAGVVNRLLASQYTKKFKVHNSSIIFNPIEIRYALTKNRHTKIMHTIDQHLLSMRQSPESIYNKSLAHWFGDVDSTGRLPKWVKWVILSVLGGFITVGFISLMLKKQVKFKTKELQSKNLLLKTEVDERKRTQEALKESEQKFRALADTSPLAIYMSEGVEQKAVYINPTFTKIFGYTIDEVPSVDQWWPLAYPDVNYRRQVADEWQKKVEHAIETKSDIEPMEVVVTCKDGLKKNISWGFITTGQQNWACGLDLTERKRADEEKIDLEAQLRQAHKMEAIGTLAGGIAHDFNNILAAILGYADMAKDSTPEWSPAKKQIDEVLKAGDRAKNLVKHILAFSRKEDQKQIPFGIHLVIKEVLKLLRASIPTTIEINQNIDPTCGNIMAEPTQIHQIIMNLCTNAAQAMDEDDGGVLNVGLHCVELKTSDLTNNPTLNPGHYVQLSVEDSGIGIDQKYLDRIFDPYFTTKEVGKGSGMGLAVVHGIVKSHDGMITVESIPGEGCKFNVYFPKIKASIQEKSEDIEPLQTGSEKILVVDDEESMTKMTKQRLQRLGYMVVAKTSSLEALELFRSQPDEFDLVITDQTMPKLTGEKLTEKLMAIRPDIPIILCTGYSSKMDAEKANCAGIRAFIMKPVDTKKLAKTIREVLDS